MDDNTCTILYVEDDPVSRLLVQRVLAAANYRMLEAEDGLSGIEVARRQHPDLILLDVNIPNMDGYAVSTRLKALPETHDIPVIALTANVMEGDRVRALSAGCDGYISKPIDVDALPDQVAAFLRGKRESVEAQAKVQMLEEHTRRLVNNLEQTITELRNANEQLRRVEKVKADFIILASHELRTPLTLIYGYSHLVLSPAMKERIPPEVHAMLAKVSEASEKLSDVVDAIVNVAVIDANQLDLVFEEIDLGALARAVVEQFRPASQERGQQLQALTLTDFPPIKGDRNYLRRAIANVVSNAIKFTPDGGLIEAWIENTGDALDLVVRDTGIGIDRGEQDHIFDKFYVLENTELHSSSDTGFKGGGLGLGLSVVRGIVEAHGGKVFVESKGHDEVNLPGSKFHLILPLNYTPLQQMDDKKRDVKHQKSI
jgi:signal transduction histidine kinase